MAFKRLLICRRPGSYVRVSFFDNKVSGVLCQPLHVVRDWEQSNPDSFNAAISCIDSQTACMIEENDNNTVVCYDNSIAWTPGESLYTMSMSELQEILSKKNGSIQPANNMMPGLEELTYEDFVSEDPIQRIISNTTGRMVGAGAASIAADVNAMKNRADNFMPPPVTEVMAGNQDYTALFAAPKKSNAIITAQILNKDVRMLPDSMIGKLILDTDSRFPTKFIPAIYDNEVGYVTLHKDRVEPVGFTEIPTVSEELVYRFNPVGVPGFNMYPDVLADVITSESKLQTLVDLSGKIRIAVNGIQNMFATDDEEEKKDILKKIYINYLCSTHFFKITYISWKTGFVQALTPTAKPVLLYAAISKGPAQRSNYTFIPINKNIGINVVGLDAVDLKELQARQNIGRG